MVNGLEVTKDRGVIRLTLVLILRGGHTVRLAGWRLISFDDLDEPVPASSRTSLWSDPSSLVVRIRARG